MADYVPLIDHAVARLATNDAESRKALYQRARVALVEQLRGVVTGPDLARERVDLEAAIRKVEARYAPTPEATPRGVTPIAPLPKLFPKATD
jgi:hypothetical protein